MHRGRPAMKLAVAIAMTVALAFTLMQPHEVTYAASATLRVDPPVSNVSAGQEFTIKVIQNAEVATAGSQTSLRFDPALVEVVSFAAGEPYASAQLLQAGSPEEAVAVANSTGLLACIATFYVPGTGSVPPGDAEFLSITLRGKAGGTSPLALVGEGCQTSNPTLEMIDENGDSLTVTGTDGSVTVSGEPPAPGQTVAPVPTATIGPPTPFVIGTTAAKGSPTPASAVLAESNAASSSASSIAVAPTTLKVAKGEEFSIDVKSNTAKPISSASMQLQFKKEAVQIETLEPGTDWTSATGASDTSLQTATTQANEQGSVETAFSLSKSPAPAGDSVVLTLRMKAESRDTTSPLRFVSVELTDVEGNRIDATPQNGIIVIGSGAASSKTTTVILLLLLLIAIAGTAGGTYYIVRRRRRQWAAV